MSTAIYREELARIQHEAFGDFARAAAGGLLRELRRARVVDGLVVDLGCGAGVWLAELTRAGHPALGVERSRPLAQIARAVAPAAIVRCGSLYDVAFPRCAAVTAIGEVLSYREPGATATSLGPLFRRIAAALVPGGLLLFDVLVAAKEPSLDARTWRAGDRWALLVDVVEQRKQGRLTRAITVFRRDGDGYRRSEERHVLSVFSRGRLTRQLRAAGFTVRVADRYGRARLPPRRLAFFACKR